MKLIQTTSFETLLATDLVKKKGQTEVHPVSTVFKEKGLKRHFVNPLLRGEPGGGGGGLKNVANPQPRGEGGGGGQPINLTS
jgi:hypothetical protein